MPDAIKYNEQELIHHLKKNDERYFLYLYDSYSGPLFTIINNIIPQEDLATDTLQLVFIKVWQNIDKYDPQKGRLYTWMLNIAKNEAINTLRSSAYTQERKHIPI